MMHSLVSLSIRVYASVFIIFALHLMATAIITTAHAADNFPSPLASHKASYRIELRELGIGAEVQDISGMEKLRFWQACDGWVQEEDFTFSFTTVYGDVVDSSGEYTIWESRTGTEFFFRHVHDWILEEENYTGTATMTARGGEAAITGSDEGVIPLPQDTLFPNQFTEAVLEAAKNGEAVFRATVFHGGGLDDSLYFVSALLGKARPTASVDFAPEFLADNNGIADNMDGLWQAEYYPMRFAYFNLGAGDSAPEYEVEFKVQENGVILSYIYDDGEASFHAHLTEIEQIADEAC